MIFFTRDLFNELQKVRQYPSISFYLPVQQEGGDTRQGSIRLRKMVKATEDALHEKGVRTVTIEKMLQPVRELYDDALFWEHQNACLALFVNEAGLTRYQLPINTDESVTISDRFMLRPMLSLLSQDGHYNLLCLGLSDTRLYRCTRHSMSEIKLDNLPDSLKAVFETYNVEKQLQHHSGSARGRRSAGGSVFHGSESMKDSEKDRIEEYFRLIDDSLRKVLADDRAPLVLACVDYLYPIFKSTAKQPKLMADHISGSPDTLKREDILRQGWEIVRPVFDQAKTAALKTCQNLMGTPRVVEDIRLILPAAQHRQIDSLFLLKNAQAWGKSDAHTGRVILADDRLPEFGEEELLDQAAMQTLLHGGQVFVLESEEMPEKTDCLAVLRYEFETAASS